MSDRCEITPHSHETLIINIAVKRVSPLAETPPGHPSLSQVILLKSLKLCETPADLIVECVASQAPHPGAFDLSL